MINLLATYKTWRYKNTFILIVSLFAVFFAINTNLGKEVLVWISKLGYLGSFISGIFFVSTFTVAPSGIILFEMGKIYNPFLLTLFAGLGAVLGDYLIFRFLKDNVFEEIKPVFMKLGGTSLTRIISTPYFVWFAPVVGALIIASPLPNEVGIGLMGISKMKNWQFVILSLFLNSLGIFLIVTLAKSI